MSDRITYIDIAKGIGIILIVLGHNSLVVSEKGILFKIIYSFHIPLFFFISGMVFNPSYTLISLVKRRYHTILKPYIATVIIYLVIKYVIDTKFNMSSVSYFLKMSLYSSGPYLFWSPLWFLTCLFMTQIAFLVAYKQILNRIDRIWLQALIMVSVLVIGVHLMKNLWLWKSSVLSMEPFVNGMKGMPWSVDLLLVCLFYFFWGFVLSRRIHELEGSITGYFFFSISLFIICHVLFPYVSDLNLRRYDDITVNTIEAVSGIAIVISLAKLTDSSKYQYIKRGLMYIGRLSLVILIFHLYIQGKTFSVSAKFLPFSKYLADVVSLVGGIIGPVLLYEIMLKRIPILKNCYVMSGSVP